jgi:hypothetical protein
MRQARFLVLAAGLTLLAQGAARAQNYKIQPIAKFGDKVGSLTIKTDESDFEVGSLNDAGQLVFVTESEAGGEMLVQYSDGQLTPIAFAGGDYPGGKWPDGLGFVSPVEMNQAGNVAFPAVVGTTPVGTFLWDFKAKQLKTVAAAGLPAVNNLTFESAGEGASINNNNEVAFGAQVKNAAGQAQSGIFFLGQDGKLLPVALPDQDLFGSKVNRARLPSLNDAGLIAFQARRAADGFDSAYLWEQGNITQLVQLGQDTPDGQKVALVFGLQLNSTNRNVVVGVRQNDKDTGPWALYMLADGKLTSVAVPGQDMPGGGKLKSVGGGDNNRSLEVVRSGNALGQLAVLATLDDDTTALYLMGADGKLSLVLKQGADTSVGKIANIGAGTQSSFGLSLNNKGQIAVTVLPENGDDTIVLLTPQ